MDFEDLLAGRRRRYNASRVWWASVGYLLLLSIVAKVHAITQTESVVP